MTDLHCHILPNIDDGAKDVSISLRLLEKEYADGVRNIAFTSHFNSEWTTPDAFLQKRAAAYETLTAALPTGPEAMQFRFKLCRSIGLLRNAKRQCLQCIGIPAITLFCNRLVPGAPDHTDFAVSLIPGPGRQLSVRGQLRLSQQILQRKPLYPCKLPGNLV